MGEFLRKFLKKHKQARTELEKLQAQSSGMVLLSEEQQQSLQGSLQALTLEEKAALEQQTIAQHQQQWLLRQSELTHETHTAREALAAAEQALATAQPQLETLSRAQPAELLRPRWTHLQEQAATLARTQQQTLQVNARLHEATTRRNRIRATAIEQMRGLQQTQTQLNQWLEENKRFAHWGSELTGWRAAFVLQARESAQLQNNQQRLSTLEKQLAQLPASTLTLNLAEASDAINAHSAARPLRQQLTTLHARFLPLQKRRQQLAEAQDNRRQQLEKLTAELTDRRQRYKVQNQQLSDVRALCEMEATIVRLEAERARLQPGCACPLCGATEHPAIAQYQALTPGVNQARRDELERDVKRLAEEGATLRGQQDALQKQQQVEESELESLSQQEQALTSQWQDVTAALGVTLRAEEAISEWLGTQEEYEQQLYQHSQRLNLQQQITDLQQQITLAQNELSQRREALQAQLTTLSLTAPLSGEENVWLTAREEESRLWQSQQTQHGETQQKLAQLQPLLDTLPV